MNRTHDRSIRRGTLSARVAFLFAVVAIFVATYHLALPAYAQSEEEQAVFVDSLHSFGYGFNWGYSPCWTCEPMFRGMTAKEGIRRCLEFAREVGYDAFGRDTLPQFVVTQPGDTLTMYGDFGRGRFVVESIRVDRVCDPLVECRLTPLDSFHLPKNSRKACLAVRSSAAEVESFRPIVKLDSAVVAAFEFETAFQGKADAANALCPHPVDYPTRFDYRSSASDDRTDTVFAFASASQCSPESRFTGLYRLVRSERGWQSTPLVDFSRGGYMTPWFIIHCAVDLNGDGVLEYIINRGSWREIINIIDGMIIVIAHGQQVSC